MKIKYRKTKIGDIDNPKKQAVHINKTKDNEILSGKNTLSYLFYFVLFVAASIIISLSARFIFLYLRSTFNTSSYAVFVDSKNPFIVSYDSVLKQLSIVKVPAVSRDKVVESVIMGVPIDAEIENKNMSEDAIFSYLSVSDQTFKPWDYDYRGMTPLDFMKLVFMAKQVPKNGILRGSLKISRNYEVSGLSQNDLYNIFKDSDLVNEQKSIEIINTTSVTGLAGMVGVMAQNMGGNVVSIHSGNSVKTSEIISNSQSETLTRLSHILGIEPLIRADTSSISDIKIILGEDFGKKFANM